MQKMNEKLEIVCVSNNLETFNQVIGANPNMNKYPITMFDNSNENIGISKRYNSYIEQNITADIDSWIIFCHQDFGFNEDPLKKIEKLSKKNIYGAIGVKAYFNLKRGLKGLLSQKTGSYFSCKINLKGLCCKNAKLFDTQEFEPTSGFIKRKLLGQISQGQNSSDFEKSGRSLLFPKEVSNLDCCCLIVHSSLINKYNLRFDENLDWHMYVEDFCINCKKNHKIKSKAVQFDCYHLGIGTLNDDFYNAAKYVKEKYNLKNLKTTCLDD